MNLKFGEVILAEVQFVDTHEIKSRPCVVLFKEYWNPEIPYDCVTFC